MVFKKKNRSVGPEFIWHIWHKHMIYDIYDIVTDTSKHTDTSGHEKRTKNQVHPMKIILNPKIKI